MLKLRPHHILDIIRNIGNGSDISPHEYGHLLHSVTESLIYDIDQECQLVVENDDICGPCIHLDENNKCDDILNQTDEKLLKQEYNDQLDTKILSYLEISPMSVIKISEFLKIVSSDLESIVKICTHPKEDMESRRSGLKNGVKLLGIEILP